MKTALVLGISGGFGGHVAAQLLKNNWKIKALMRDTGKLPKSLNTVEKIQGDAANMDDVRNAAANVDVIVYGVNIPYARWHQEALSLLNISATVAEQQRLTILFPGNVYIFNPSEGSEFGEHSPMHPIVSFGEIRRNMEQRLNQASNYGAMVIIIRAGDFIGAGAPSTWIHQLVKPTAKGITVAATGPRDMIHSWAYLPDVATSAVALLTMQNDLPAFSVFHFKGYQISFNDIASALHTATGKTVKLSHFPWWLLRIISPFSPMFRGLIEMRYLWQKELNLTETKLAKQLNNQVTHTPLPVALAESGLSI